LAVKVNIPEDARIKNQMLALADRHAIFKGDCASCHVQPAAGLKGEALFHTACGICHEAPHRASMVPDLKGLNKPVDFDYWHTWISKGKEQTLMPGFAKSEGGPLDEEQVLSLTEFLTHRFPPRQSFSVPTPYHDD
jgi:mono/diheme cytochrome c family protein